MYSTFDDPDKKRRVRSQKLEGSLHFVDGQNHNTEKVLLEERKKNIKSNSRDLKRSINNEVYYFLNNTSMCAAHCAVNESIGTASGTVSIGTWRDGFEQGENCFWQLSRRFHDCRVS